MDVIHSAIWVSDLDRMLEFYVDELGLEKTIEFESGDGATNVFVAGPNGVELQFKHEAGKEIERSANGVYDHVAVAVEDTDAEVERLCAEGSATLTRGPLDSEGANARVAFIEDPEGNGVELVEEYE
ncbi:MAG TPA: VOC family protein [Halobacteriales archaeon]|nr:VOC family protein [Halobacteriales archaeon]